MVCVKLMFLTPWLLARLVRRCQMCSPPPQGTTGPIPNVIHFVRQNLSQDSPER